MADISGKEVKIHFLAAFNELAITPEKKNFGSSGIVIEDYNKNTGKKFWAMIDTGCSGPRDTALLKKYFKAHNIKELEYVLLTHYHGDHVGGIKKMLDENMVKIKRLVLPMNKTVLKEVLDLGGINEAEYNTAISHITDIESRFDAYKSRNNYTDCTREFFRLSKVSEMEESFNLGNAQYTFLNTSPKVQELVSNQLKKLDKNCLVIMLKIGNTKVLLPGDIYPATQTYLMNKVGSAGLSADVMQMCHHGTKAAWKESFVTTVNPEAAIACINYNAEAVQEYSKVIRDEARLYTTSQEMNKLWNQQADKTAPESGKASIILRIQNDEILYYSRRFTASGSTAAYEHVRIPDEIQYNAVNDSPKED